MAAANHRAGGAAVPNASNHMGVGDITAMDVDATTSTSTSTSNAAMNNASRMFANPPSSEAHEREVTVVESFGLSSFICSICEEPRYSSEAMVLCCGHIVCTYCRQLEIIWQGKRPGFNMNEIACPTCRQVTLSTDVRQVEFNAGNVAPNRKSVAMNGEKIQRLSAENEQLSRGLEQLRSAIKQERESVKEMKEFLDGLKDSETMMGSLSVT